jgi:hypothetical protein
MRGWTPTSSAIERVLRPSAASNTMRARFTSRCAVVGAPAASLKHLAYLRLEPNVSCFGNHPDLESLLTQEEKWVLCTTPHQIEL